MVDGADKVKNGGLAKAEKVERHGQVRWATLLSCKLDWASALGKRRTGRLPEARQPLRRAILTQSPPVG